MKKILYIEANKDGTIGGSYYSLLYLIQELNKKKYEPHVLFCQDNVLMAEFRNATQYVYINDFDPTFSTRAENFTDIIKWPYRLLTEVVLKQSKLKKIINEIQPDLIHLNNGYSSMHEWMLACYLNNIKVIAHDRGTRYPCSFRTKLFTRFLDAIISVSDSYKNNVVMQNLKVKRLYRVYNGLDSDKIIKDINLAANDKIKKEFNLNGECPTVGIIGNITMWKGQLIVLQAINKVKQFYHNIKCLIVGDICKGSENYKDKLDEYIKNNGLYNNIIFTGFRKNIPQILSLLDIFIHASIEPEPFGRVILEGMAMSKPIIATNVGGPAEIIVEGETGILVPMNDSDKMADAIIYYLSDMKRAKEMGEKGRQRLIEMFSIKRMVEETEKVYEDIFN